MPEAQDQTIGKAQKMPTQEALQLMELPDAISGMSKVDLENAIDGACELLTLLLAEDKDEHEGIKDSGRKDRPGYRYRHREKASDTTSKPEVHPGEIDSRLMSLDDKVAEKRHMKKSSETIHKEQIYYIGDSYMVGITNRGGIKSNKNAESGRPLLPRSKGKWSGGNDIQTITLNTIRKMNKGDSLVMDGGLNDLYGTGKDVKGVADRIIESFSTIIEAANLKGIKLIICNIPDIPKKHVAGENVDIETRRINRELAKQSGVEIIDTYSVIGGVFSKKDKTHAMGSGYAKIAKEIENRNA